MGTLKLTLEELAFLDQALDDWLVIQEANDQTESGAYYSVGLTEKRLWEFLRDQYRDNSVTWESTFLLTVEV